MVVGSTQVDAVGLPLSPFIHVYKSIQPGNYYSTQYKKLNFLFQVLNPGSSENLYGENQSKAELLNISKYFGTIESNNV